MERRLPAWTPFLIAVVGLLLIPIMFAIPRDSEAVDTFLEAVPFFVIALGVVAFPFSKAGPSRIPGVVFAAVVLLSPVWFPASMMLAWELGRDPPSVRVELSLVPEDDESPYTILVPAPVDRTGRLAAVLEAAKHPPWDAVEDRAGTPHLRISWTGTLERTFSLEGERSDPKWPPTEFPLQRTRSDAPPYASILTEGNTTVVVHMRIIGDEPYCNLDGSYHAAAGPDQTGFARLGERDEVCT